MTHFIQNVEGKTNDFFCLRLQKKFGFIAAAQIWHFIRVHQCLSVVKIVFHWHPRRSFWRLAENLFPYSKSVFIRVHPWFKNLCVFIRGYSFSGKFAGFSLISPTALVSNC